MNATTQVQAVSYNLDNWVVILIEICLGNCLPILNMKFEILINVKI